jgi:hypothetical protein
MVAAFLSQFHHSRNQECAATTSCLNEEPFSPQPPGNRFLVAIEVIVGSEFRRPLPQISRVSSDM